MAGAFPEMGATPGGFGFDTGAGIGTGGGLGEGTC
jgi:hypothetical protein